MDVQTSKRFLESTRGQVLSHLRRGAGTVEDLARALGLTDNAIRAHLATLERDGLVSPAGQRRGPGAGKPAQVYELAPDADVRLSRAYAPVLAALLEELALALPGDQTAALLTAVGRRLAAGRAPRSGPLEERVREAAALLIDLGGEASWEREGTVFRIRGCGCPLSAAVARRPETCRAVQSLLADVIGAPVVECCTHGARPSCCFTVSATA